MDSAPGFGPGGCGFKVRRSQSAHENPARSAITDVNMAGMILFKEKQARILMSLKNVQQPWRVSSLSKACDITYVHAHNFIKECEELNLTSNVRHGKIKEIKLTKSGAKVAEMVSGIFSILEQAKAKSQKQEAPKQSTPAAAEK